MSKDTTLPRGMRLCNPGNIRHNGHTHWKGLSPTQPDVVFCRFANMALGFRAMWIRLNNKYVRGARDLHHLIWQWAQPSEYMDTPRYIEKVVRRVAWPASHFLPDHSTCTTEEERWQTYHLWEDIILAMTSIEQGIEDREKLRSLLPHIRKGYYMAFWRKAPQKPED